MMEYVYILSSIFFYIGVTVTIGTVLIYAMAKVSKHEVITQKIGKMVFLLIVVWILEIAANAVALFFS